MKDEDPFKAIREAYKTWKPTIDKYKGNQIYLSGFPSTEGFIALWIAISETIKIIGEEDK
jgi:hypothetical protein